MAPERYKAVTQSRASPPSSLHHLSYARQTIPSHFPLLVAFWTSFQTGFQKPVSRRCVWTQVGMISLPPSRP